jgi:RNA polymerase sigma-70 factor (ECF subfamily)
MESQEETHKLLVQAQEGDRKAFETLVEAHRPRLLSFVRRRLGSRLRGRTQAEDILQEALLRALGSLERFEWQGKDSFFCWLATIAEHIIQNLNRSLREPPVALEAEHAGSGPSPSRVLRREERFDRLKAAVASLSGDHRDVILLARIEGLPIADVARRMGRSPGAVRHLLLRALEKLRERFGEDTESLTLPARALRSKEVAGEPGCADSDSPGRHADGH